MRFAVVGDSPSVTRFVRAVVLNADHELASFALAPRLHEALFPLAPAARLHRGWEEVLTDRRIDAVIVAGDDDGTLQAARQLAATGKVLFVSPTSGQAANFAYEMTLLQDEQDARLVPMFGLRAHPLVASLRGILASGRIGAVRHVQIECRIAPTESADPATGCLSAADIAAAFLPDTDLLRSIWGEYAQVTAVRSGDDAGGISMETITLAGSAFPQVVWTATVAAGEALWRLNVVGQLGNAVLIRAAGGEAWSLETSTGSGPTDREQATFDSDDWLLREFPPTAVTGSTALAVVNSLPGSRVSYPGWGDFTRAAELLDAAERSIRRRRTIEIHFETPSERGQFKTQMTAVGCSLLMFTLAAIVVYLTAASLVDMNARLKQVLVVLIFLPLGLFLALQGLLVLARPSAPAGGDADGRISVQQDPKKPA